MIGSLNGGSPSIDHLCKTIVFENTRHPGDGEFDPKFSKYYAVVIQYTGKLNAQKLLNYARDLKEKSLSKKNYNMRVAAEEVSLDITGYDSGGIVPIGMKKQEKIPIIMSKEILHLQPPVIWLGAGHVDWKVAFPISSFVASTKCFIGDLE
ncbi:hypothetical protein HDU67_008968 [Dinochytrium kinnereticum]|nr:hypothetical protein HDU67_008968 [Dinochytrium kinnereticum]